VPLHPYDRAFQDLQRLRADYLPYLRATIAVFLVPPEFRNHAAPLPLRERELGRWPNSRPRMSPPAALAGRPCQQEAGEAIGGPVPGSSSCRSGPSAGITRPG